jgi:hypothetical protein
MEENEMTIEKANNRQHTKEQFPLGAVVATPGVLAAVTQPDIANALRRHQCADWGTVGQTDWKENDLALNSGCRVLSTYVSSGGVTFWIITESDRSSTCVLLPEEY